MPIGLLALAGLALPLVIAYAATPVAIRVAGHLNFYDHPVGYKGHARPTPYLGGAAVVGAFVLAALLVVGQPHRTVPVVAGMLVLWCVGTIDDRVGLSPRLRLGVEAVLAAVLWRLGLGWDLGLGGAVDLVVTVLWIAAVVNAFNLFDNMDGAATTLAAAAAAGTALLGIVIGDRWLTAAAAALCGACLGFLPHNLSSPAKIFLGDGGSMPVGFGVAALVMIGSAGAASEWQALAMGLLFVGIPAVDTCLVMISRRRRGVSLLTGGRDHLTHRARGRLRTARAVAVSLGGAQALLAVLALMTVHNGSGALVAVVCIYLVAAGVAIAILDTNFEPDAVAAGSVGLSANESRGGRASASSVGLGLVVVPLGLAVGVSSFAEGLYASTRWAPAGLGLIALLVAVALARPARLTAAAGATVAGLTGLAGWALLSSTWGASAHAAMVDGNRLVVYAVFLGVCLLLLRTRRAALWALAAVTAGAVAVGLWELGQMLFTDGHRVIAGGRLQGPLGYINGQGSVAALALFPCIALAERRRAWLAGVGAGCATVLIGLVILSQSRGAVLAVLAGLAVAFVAAPGRARRAAVVLAVGIGTLAGSHWVFGVYSQTHFSTTPRGAVRDGALALLAASTFVGVGWAGLLAQAKRANATRLAWVVRGWRRALAAGAAVVALAVAVQAPALAGAVSRQLHDFSHSKAVATESTGSSSRLATDGTNRYEYWRIATDAFADHPVEGVGAGSYDVTYFRLRSSVENVTQPHSLVFQTLSELGIVGVMLLALFVGGVISGIVRCARAARRSPGEASLLVAAGGTFTAWLVHTSVDWIHLLPGVTAVALLAAAVLLRPLPAASGPPVAEAPPRTARRPQRRPGLLIVPVLALAIAGAAVSLGRQVLAEHYRDNAQAIVVRDPAAALRQADLALGVDGSDTQSLDVKSAALSRMGQERQAGAVLRQALGKEPKNFITYLLLGDHEVRSGDLEAARDWYRRALALNPRDPTIRALVRNPGS